MVSERSGYRLSGVALNSEFNFIDGFAFQECGKLTHDLLKPKEISVAGV